MAFKDLALWSRRAGVPVVRGSLSPLGTRDFDALFDRFFGDLGFGSPWAPAASQPRPSLDVSESDGAYHVSAEVPGFEEKDIEVTVHDGYLALKGEKQAETEDKQKNYLRREQTRRSFHRVVALPGDVEASRVEATYKNGILSIDLPKAASSRTRKVEVKAA